MQRSQHLSDHFVELWQGLLRILQPFFDVQVGPFSDDGQDSGLTLELLHEQPFRHSHADQHISKQAQRLALQPQPKLMHYQFVWLWHHHRPYHFIHLQVSPVLAFAYLVSFLASFDLVEILVLPILDLLASAMEHLAFIIVFPQASTQVWAQLLVLVKLVLAGLARQVFFTPLKPLKLEVEFKDREFPLHLLRMRNRVSQILIFIPLLLLLFSLPLLLSSLLV